MKALRIGIFPRTALLSWGIAVLAVVALGMFIIPLQRRSLLEGLESKARVMTASVQDVTAGALVTEDYSAVVDHCTEILRGDAAIQYIAIVRNDGFSLIHTRESWRSETLPDDWRPSVRIAGWSLATTALSEGDVFAYRKPLDYSAINWGWIHVGLSLDSYRESVSVLKRRTTQAALLCILLGLGVSIAYARRLVRPLWKLRDAVHRLAAGDLAARANIRSGDEVENLADSFNRMAASLQSTHHKLQAAHDYTSGILSSMNDALLVASLEGRILTANPALCSLVGRDEHDLVGHPVDMVLVGGLGGLSLAAEARAADAGLLARNVENTLETRDGTHIPVLLSASLMRDPGTSSPRIVCVAVDIRERKREETARRERDQRLRRQNEVLAALALQKGLYSGDVATAWRSLTEAAALTTGVPRASVWLVAEDGQWIVCEDLFEPALGRHSVGPRLSQKDYPKYFEAIAAGRFLASEQARQDPRTIEFRASYLEPLDIHALLDAAIKVGGEVVGIVCLEQTGETRRWTEDEQQFASSLADLAAIAIEARDRRIAEELLRRRDAMLEATRFAAEKFLRAETWADCIEAVLRRMGRALDVSRVYVFENRLREDGALLTSQRFEWAGAGITPQINNPILQDFSYADQGFARWAQLLGRGEIVEALVSQIPAAERDLLAAQQIQTIVQVPIQVNGAWWGFLGFDDCARERHWLPAELDSLKAVAENLGAAIQRQKAQEDIVRSKEAAEAASRAKSQFLANMSHEIRTPINGVVGMLKLLAAGKLEDKQQRYVQTAIASSDALLTVINDILDFSKIEAGRLDLERVSFNPDEVIDTAISMFADRARQKHLQLTHQVNPDVPRRLMGDPNRLLQILMNLLSNAVKFTNRGEVAVRVERLEDQLASVRLRLSVSDTGPGLTAQVQAALFSPFFQGDASTTRRHGGTGLGLAICKQLAELMGGHIRVESRSGQGATFMVEITFAKDRSAQSSTGPRTAHPEAGPGPAAREQAPAHESSASDALCAPDPVRLAIHVLVAEDNEINRMVAQEVIRASGFQCTCVNDGRAAVEAALHGNYQVVLMDCQMPVMDGYEATRAIREHERTAATGGAKPRRIPIVALTAHAMKGDRETCLAAGMDDYLTKPLDPHRVRQVIEQWTQSHEAARPDAGSAAPRPTPAPETAAVFDEAALLKRCLGRLPLAQKVLAQFVRQGKEDIDQLLGAVRAGDAATARSLAHRMKGAAANSSALQIWATAAEIEDAAKRGPVAPDHPAAGRLPAEWAGFLELSGTFLKKAEATYAS